MEKWIKIPDFDLYEASNTGKLRSINYKRSGKTVELKPALTGGYLKTMLLKNDGKYISRPIHYFVTLAFFGKRSKDIEVNHKDGNKLNNNIDNLEYCTREENMAHCKLNKLQKVFVSGSKHGQAKLNESQIKEIRDYVANFGHKNYGRKALAEKYGISEAHIKDIVNRRRNVWKNV